MHPHDENSLRESHWVQIVMQYRCREVCGNGGHSYHQRSGCPTHRGKCCFWWYSRCRCHGMVKESVVRRNETNPYHYLVWQNIRSSVMYLCVPMIRRCLLSLEELLRVFKYSRSSGEVLVLKEGKIGYSISIPNEDVRDLIKPFASEHSFYPLYP